MFRQVTTIVSLLAVNILCGQTVLRTKPDSAVQHDSGIHVTVIDPHYKATQNYSGKPISGDSVQMALKCNPTLILRGDFPLYYEYRLSHSWSVEGALGITYVDYMYELFTNQARFISMAGERNNVHFLSGFSARAQVRWYPSRYSSAITGFYIAPEISRRDWQMDYLVNTGFINEPHRLKRTWNEFRLQVGYQDADPYENIFWEWYLSAGIRYADEDVVDGSGLDATFSHETNWVGVFGGGIKMGFTL